MTDSKLKADKFIDATATVDTSAVIGVGSRIWQYVQIRENVKLGLNVVIGKGTYIGPGVFIGSNSKIQNNVLIYEPTVIGDGVFLGPGTILTNDKYPRAINSDGSQKSSSDWEQAKVEILEGASLGAGVICVAPVKIGRWSLVAAGAIVVEDVPDFALVAGSPARRIGWVGKAGVRLLKCEDNALRCPLTDEIFVEKGGSLWEAEKKS